MVTNCEKEVSYIRYLLTSDGLKIDPYTVQGITHVPKPTDIKGVQKLTVIYLLNFVHIFQTSARFSDIWLSEQEEQEEAFCKIKETIVNAAVLKYYNPDEELTIQCDASDTGLGAAHTKRGEPVAFASRALTHTERCYERLEKEFLAILFSM